MDVKVQLNVFILLLVSLGVKPAKILLIIVAPGSHTMNFVQMAEGLIARGHEVHALTNDLCKNSEKLSEAGVTLHGFQPPSGCVIETNTELVEKQLELIANGSFYGIIVAMKTNGIYTMEEAESIFDNKQLMEGLNEARFDLCILDAMFAMPYYFLVPYKLGIPYMSFPGVYDPVSVGAPSLPSFIPGIMSPFTHEMTFFERLGNAVLRLIIYNDLLNYYNPASRDDMVRRYVPEKPFKSFAEIKLGSSLWLVMNDISMDYPQVRMPHVVDIGGLNARPPKALPDDLQHIADGASHHGLIIISFGSYIKKLRGESKDKLLNELRQLKQTVIWRQDGPVIPDLPKNIHTRAWIPQNDLLAHPNTKIFITHCGLNGQFEALYNQVPMIGLPIFGDQFYSSARMAKHGLGIGLGLLSFKEGDIVSAVNEILRNDTYKRNIVKRSQIFKDRPMSPLDTLVYWVEHVHKYGDAHLLSPALHLPWYIYWCIDLILFCIVAIIVLLVLLYYTFKLVRCCCRRSCAKRKQD